MNLFGWMVDTWWEWSILIGSMLAADLVLYVSFGFYIFLHILEIFAKSSGKGGGFKGGGGRSGGGGSNGSW